MPQSHNGGGGNNKSFATQQSLNGAIKSICDTSGFLAQAYEHMAGTMHVNITAPDELDTLRRRTFYGREKDNTICPIALANLVLHNIDEPHIWHGNTLTGAEHYGGCSLLPRRSLMRC